MHLNYAELEAVANSLPMLISYVDRERRYRMCNTGYAARFGLTPESVIGRTVAEIVGDKAWQTIEPRLSAGLDGHHQDFEIEAPFPVTGLRRFRALYMPQRDQTGSVTGVVAAITDVAHQGRAESELRESEAKFRNMADHSPIILWMSDSGGACTYLNQRWSEFTGWNPPAGLGLGWLDAIHPDDRARREHTLAAVIKDHRPYRAEYRLRRHTGDYHWVLDTASPRRSDKGDFLGYIGSMVDIQDRKEVEEALRTSRVRFDLVKDAAQVGFWFCDLPFDVLEWDNRVKEHFWLAPEDTVTIDLFYDRLHPDDRERTRAAIARSNIENSRYDIEYRTVDAKTGAEKWIRAIGRTFYDSAEQPIRFDGVTLDITEKKRDEDALREAKEQAEFASRAKDDFLAQLSHELRTPLTPVLMMAAALREDEQLPETTRRQLDMIARNVELEARLIDDLLDLTRITHGSLALRLETCDVHALFHLVVEIVAEERSNKSISVTLELDAKYYCLTADSARLQQVFWNLLRNAVKFTPQGGRIWIRTSNSGDSGSELLRIEVIDDGAGFEPTLGETLFKPFERGTVGHDPRFPGLGLGLAIARAIVTLHQGTIAARSDGPGRGATFTVDLCGARGPIHATASAPGRVVQSVLPFGLRLLLVEDHVNTRDVLSHLLRRDGHQISTAGSVAEALRIAETIRFDLIVSDLGLPDGTGIELMGKLRARHGLRGIALSGYGMEKDLLRSAEAGFVAHLIKPVDLNTLKRILRQHAPAIQTNGQKE